MKVWVCKWIFIGVLGIFAISPETVFGLTFQPISFDSSQVVKDSWFGLDKAKHFLGSMFLTGSVTYWSHSKWNMSREQSQIVGISVVFSLGMWKEFRDSARPSGLFSWKDLVFDVLGIGAGFLCFSWW